MGAFQDITKVGDFGGTSVASSQLVNRHGKWIEHDIPLVVGLKDEDYFVRSLLNQGDFANFTVSTILNRRRQGFDIAKITGIQLHAKNAQSVPGRIHDRTRLRLTVVVSRDGLGMENILIASG